MPGPWEQYQQPQQAGPWSRYQGTSTPPAAPKAPAIRELEERPTPGIMERAAVNAIPSAVNWLNSQRPGASGDNSVQGTPEYLGGKGVERPHPLEELAETGRGVLKLLTTDPRETFADDPAGTVAGIATAFKQGTPSATTQAAAKGAAGAAVESLPEILKSIDLVHPFRTVPEVINAIKKIVAGGKEGVADLRAAERVGQPRANTPAWQSVQPEAAAAPASVEPITPAYTTNRASTPAQRPTETPTPRSRPGWTDVQPQPQAAPDIQPVPATQTPSGRTPGKYRETPEIPAPITPQASTASPAAQLAQELTGSPEGGTIPFSKANPEKAAFEAKARTARGPKVEALAKRLHATGVTADQVESIPKTMWRDLSDELGIDLPKTLTSTVKAVQKAVFDLQKANNKAPVVVPITSEVSVSDLSKMAKHLSESGFEPEEIDLIHPSQWPAMAVKAGVKLPKNPNNFIGNLKKEMAEPRTGQ